MTYRILSTGKGVITTRQPKVEKENATFLFNNAPPGAMAVFTMSNATYYRQLTAGRCNIPAKYLEGDIAVSITINDRNAQLKRYACEGIKATKLTEGVLLAPNDSNLAEEFAKARVEIDELREKIKDVSNELKLLKEMFEEMKEGYNLI